MLSPNGSGQRLRADDQRFVNPGESRSSLRRNGSVLVTLVCASFGNLAIFVRAFTLGQSIIGLTQLVHAPDVYCVPSDSILSEVIEEVLKIVEHPAVRRTTAMKMPMLDDDATDVAQNMTNLGQVVRGGNGCPFACPFRRSSGVCPEAYIYRMGHITQNAAHHWRRAADARNETRTLSRRPVNAPCSFSFSRLVTFPQ